jgi:hypothetical protein
MQRYPQWWREEKHRRYVLAQEAEVLRKRDRSNVWRGIYIGWSALGWTIIFAHYFHIGN